MDDSLESLLGKGYCACFSVRALCLCALVCMSLCQLVAWLCIEPAGMGTEGFANGMATLAYTLVVLNWYYLTYCREGHQPQEHL